MNSLSRTPFVLVCALAVSACLVRAAGDAAPDQLSLDGTWRFQLAPTAADADRLSAFHTDEFDASAFTPMPVPSNWTTHGFEEPHYVNGTKSEGFYLHTFDVPASVAGRRTILHFGGVWQSAEVWLNGQLLGRHDSGFTSFALEASRALKPGEQNRLAVRVRQQTNLFKLDANDDWALPGIYRNVWLEFTPKELFIESVSVETDFDESYRDATLSARVFISRDARADFFAHSPPFEIRATLKTADGATVQQTKFEGVIQGAHNGRDIPLSMLVREPAAWTAETPNLHDLSIELVNEGEILHTWTDRIGFREVSTAGGILRVNGRPVKLRGVARHDQHPDTGRATTPEQWREEIELMKAGNINAVRCAHYPPAEGFVRLCDEMGIYVIDEVPFGFGGDRMWDPNFAEGVFLRVYETVIRDRNRPSVIIWSVGNEDPFSSMHLAALRALKGLDPTRPTLLPFRAETWLPPEVDILAPHYWTAAEYDRLAASVNRPVVTTEYTHALGPDDFGGFQQRWDAITRHPAGAGGMIWLWADQGLRRPINGREVVDPMREKSKYTREGSELVFEKQAGPDAIYDAHGNYGADGIIDADRVPQRDYWEAKAVYAPVRVMVDRVPFRFGQESVTIPVRNDFDFLNLSLVSLKWQLFDGAKVVDQGEERLEATPHETASLLVPTGALASADPARSVAYLHILAQRADGSELGLSSVRLGDHAVPHPEGPAAAGTKPQVRRSGDSVTITAGSARYQFNSKSGEISGVSIDGKQLINGASLVVWRPATYSERNRLDRRPNQHDWDTFMQGLRPSLKSWDIVENGATGVTITVRAEYRADSLNSVTTNYTYTVTPTGTLNVALEVFPQMDVPELPEIGIEFLGASKATRLTWLGQGPLDSLPNKIAATTFGWWSARADAKEATGTKSTLEWARLGLGNGAALHVNGSDGVRLIDGAGATPRLRVFTTLGGAWTKNGPPERPEWYLELKEGVSFKGGFELVPMAGTGE